MKQLRITSAFCLLLSAFVAACGGGPRRPASQTPVTHAEMQTIDNSDPRPAVADPPPVLRDEAPPPKPKGQPWETPEPVVLTPEDEKLRASLPFSPAIALDPIDGQKISILARTPMLEYKGHVYYFSSEENKRMFQSNPEEYSKGMAKRM